MNLASRWKRFWGAMIDGVIYLGIVVPIMLMNGSFQMALKREEFTIGQRVILFVIGWLVFLILNGYLLSERGQTIGKVVVKTKIIDMNGKVPNFVKLLVLRYMAFGFILQIPIVGSIVNFANILFIFTNDRRCLHDHLAGTRVVDA